MSSLVDLWKISPDQLREKRIDQVIGFAGDGRLGDKHTAPIEFREFLAGIPSAMISRYADECLSGGFKDSGLALQDIVNEIGHRLGFIVGPGRYRGSRGIIGYDGLWEGPGGHKIVVEVKTTDAYRIDLGVVAGYRKGLIKEGKIDEELSSILIVVGRQDTGDLEAQIRGSQYAWDIRLISADSLLRLLSIKEEVEDPGIERRIRDILIPREYTRVDEIIELVFSTTEEIRQEELPANEEGEEGGDTPPTTREKPVGFNDACARRIEVQIGMSLVKRSRVTYQSPDGQVGLVCAVSKGYPDPRGTGYWFAFHPHQQEFLQTTAHGYVAFGCGSPDQIVLFPLNDIVPLLGGMNQTHTDDGRSYWHVLIHREDNKWTLHRRKGEDRPDITQYVLKESRKSFPNLGLQPTASSVHSCLTPASGSG